MTEPHAGEPGEFKCQAVRDGDEWVINGEKWFTSNGNNADFLLVMAITAPEKPLLERASMFIVDTDLPGVEIVRNVHTLGTPLRENYNTGPGRSGHSYIRYNDVRVPASALLGEEGGGFVGSQTRLSGGRIHHAMRAVGTCTKALDMMCERVKSRRAKGELLSEKQMVQEKIADSYIQLKQFRLHVLYTAWLIDKTGKYTREIRKEIAAIKVSAAKVNHDIVYRAIHIHGALGMSNETPLGDMWMSAPYMGIMDGGTESHKENLVKLLLRDYEACDDLFPTYHLPKLIEKSQDKFEKVIEVSRRIRILGKHMALTRDEARAQLTSPGAEFELENRELYGRQIRSFKNGPHTLRQLFAESVSDLDFFVYESERYTFKDTFEKASQIAHLLIDEYGVQKGDRVAISMRNYPEWVFSFVATTSIGATAVAMNALWTTEEMQYGLTDSGAKVLIADQERLDRVTPVLPELDLSVLSVRVGDDKDLMTAASLKPTEMPNAEVQPEDRATILYTSGSTGHPKGAVSCHLNVLSALRSWELDQQTAAIAQLDTPPEPPPYQPAGLMAVPLFHATGSHAVFLMSFRAQRKLVSMYKWDPMLAAELIEAERISGFVAPAAMTGDLLKLPEKLTEISAPCSPSEAAVHLELQSR